MGGKVGVAKAVGNIISCIRKIMLCGRKKYIILKNKEKRYLNSEIRYTLVALVLARMKKSNTNTFAFFFKQSSW